LKSGGTLKAGFIGVVLGALLMLSAVPAFAQACAMCYSTAKATSKEGQRAITRGVVILAIPPLSVMTVGVGFAFRYGRKRDRDQERDNVDLIS